MSISTQPYKGARDFYPEDLRFRKWMFNKWAQICELYGYEEYDSPILEPSELYLSKGNDEIVNEQTYSFTDRGGRNITIRTEMTPSVSRMVAGRVQELNYPLRWYSIPGLWRYEKPQRGRGREFYQLNVDVFGIKGLAAEHECLLIVADIMKSFGAKQNMYQIKLNSRKFINSLLEEYLGFDDVQATTLIRLIDRMNKMKPEEFQALAVQILTPSQRESGIFEKMMTVMQSRELASLPDSLQNHSSVIELKKLMEMLSSSGIKNAEFDISLMRGFDYYTDIVFEIFDLDPNNNRSMFGGGRYDGLVSMFGVEPIPVVGFAMGDITLSNFLDSHELMPNLFPETDIYVALIGDVYLESQKLLAELRQEGVKITLDSSGRKLDKLIKDAIKKDIKYIMFIGEHELVEQMFKLKRLDTKTEQTLSLERIISTVLANKNNNFSNP